ncbi:hypothetical protein DINM_004603 [Dirofilaria immitis]|nr:hypothetical protein [Dirofilaria immitis]
MSCLPIRQQSSSSLQSQLYRDPILTKKRVLITKPSIIRDVHRPKNPCPSYLIRMNLNKLASAVKSVMERTESICAEKIHEELSNPNKSDIIRKKKCAHEWTSKKKWWNHLQRRCQLSQNALCSSHSNRRDSPLCEEELKYERLNMKSSERDEEKSSTELTEKLDDDKLYERYYYMMVYMFTKSTVMTVTESYFPRWESIKVAAYFSS